MTENQTNKMINRELSEDEVVKLNEVASKIKTMLEEAKMALQPYLEASTGAIRAAVRLVYLDSFGTKEPSNES